MNKEFMQSRLDELNKALEQAVNQYNALLGRQAEVQFFLEKEDKEPKPESQPSPSTDDNGKTESQPSDEKAE